jgi:inner membrane protein
MPSAISHIIAGTSLGYALNNRNRDLLFYCLAAGISILPDMDVLAFSFGIPYGDVFGHRGFFHSLVFAFMISLMLALMVYRSRDFTTSGLIRMFLMLFIIAVTHPILDAMTGGGLGIGLFIPFYNGRIFFPLRPIAVSPIGVKEFFSQWGLRVIKSELHYVIIPSLAVIILVFTIRSAFSRNAQN